MKLDFVRRTLLPKNIDTVTPGVVRRGPKNRTTKAIFKIRTAMSLNVFISNSCKVGVGLGARDMRGIFFPWRSLNDEVLLELHTIIEDLVRGCLFLVLFWTSKKVQKEINLKPVVLRLAGPSSPSRVLGIRVVRMTSALYLLHEY